MSIFVKKCKQVLKKSYNIDNNEGDILKLTAYNFNNNTEFNSWEYYIQKYYGKFDAFC